MNTNRKSQLIKIIFLALLTLIFSSLACTSVPALVDLYVGRPKDDGKTINLAPADTESDEGLVGSNVDNPQNDTHQEEQENGRVDDPNIVGTYTVDEGETPPGWYLVESEFTINVAEDGTVSGFRTYIIRKETVGAICTFYYENGHEATIYGQLFGANGFITIETKSHTISDSSECDGPNSQKTYEAVCPDMQIAITTGTMEISPAEGNQDGNCGLVFIAHKQ